MVGRMGWDGRIRIPLQKDTYNKLLALKVFQGKRSYSELIEELISVYTRYLELKECIQSYGGQDCVRKLVY